MSVTKYFGADREISTVAKAGAVGFDITSAYGNILNPISGSGSRSESCFQVSGGNGMPDGYPSMSGYVDNGDSQVGPATWLDRNGSWFKFTAKAAGTYTFKLSIRNCDSNCYITRSNGLIISPLNYGWKDYSVSMDKNESIYITEAGGYILGVAAVTYPIEFFDTAPNNPSNINPLGTSDKPAIVSTLNPSLSWSFTDLDIGDSQSAYQVKIVNGNNTTEVKWDSGKINSGNSSIAIPVGALKPNNLYAWAVKVWDSPGSESNFTNWSYFKTTKAPVVILRNPNGGSDDKPTAVSLTPHIEWYYIDAENDEQKTYRILITRSSDSVVVLDTKEVVSSNKFYDVPDGKLEPGKVYKCELTVSDATGMYTESNAVAYFLTNFPPGDLNIISPTDTYRTTKRPSFELTIGDDPEDNSQNFILQLATNKDFTENLIALDTRIDVLGWEVKTPTGNYEPISKDGVNSTYEGGRVKYTIQKDLQEGVTYYWRMAPIDAYTNSLGNWTPVRSIRVGNILSFKLKKPIVTSAAAARIVFKAVEHIATDGVKAAEIKVEACNNGLDDEATWEEVTKEYLNGTYHTFLNNKKASEKWAVDVKITITANDSLGSIEILGFGFSFD